MLFSFKMVCAANVDCDPRIVLVPSVQRAPNTYWFEGTRPQLEALVLCLSCLAGLANSFKHPLALFKWENRVSISVRKTQESAPPHSLSVYAERTLSGWQLPVLEKSDVCVSYDLNMKCPPETY